MKTVLLISNGTLKYAATDLSDGQLIIVEDGKKSTLEFDSTDLNKKAINEITKQWVKDAQFDKRVRNRKIEKILLLEAVGNFLCDDDLLAAWKRIKRAIKQGKGDTYASGICELVQVNEYDTVRQIHNEIIGYKSNLWEVVKRVDQVN